MAILLSAPQLLDAPEQASRQIIGHYDSDEITVLDWPQVRPCKIVNHGPSVL